jgi:tRNA pseudouridine38-40 synthase
VLGERSYLRVAGRTDAGVHATAQVVSLDAAHGHPATDPRRLRQSLNGLLPHDVAVREVTLAADGFDARTHALSRTYDYRVLAAPPSPLRRSRTFQHMGPPLDRAALDACAAACVGQHDFTAFTPSGSHHVFFHRTVLQCHWRDEGDEIVLRIEANAFLRHMVRVLVGTMLECGRRRRPVDDFKALLEGAPRSAAGPTALPHALTLIGVRYG